MTQRHPTIAKTTTVGKRKYMIENKDTKQDGEKEKKEEKEETSKRRLRGMNTSLNSKKRLTLEDIITPEKPKKIATKIEEIFLCFTLFISC